MMIAQLESPAPLRLSSKLPKGNVQVITTPQRHFHTDVMASALRSAGQGTMVLIVQFFQGGIGQGIHAPRRLVENLQWLRADLHRTIEMPHPQLQPAEITAILGLWQEVRQALELGTYNLLVLDELSLVTELGLIPESEVIRAIEHRSPGIDVILTGMAMPEAFLGIADQVTQKRIVN